MSASIDGLASGLQTTDLIAQLMAAERVPQDRLVRQRDKAKAVVTAYQGLNTKLAALRDAAGALADQAGWNAMKATSTAPTIATATPGANALGGTLSFNVTKLASSSSMVSSGAMPSLTSLITTGRLLVSAGGAALGVSSFAGTGLNLGAHSIKVTQASAGATKTASGALAGTTNIVDGVNDVLALELDGGVFNLDLDAGSYSSTALAAHIQAKSGGALKASVDSGGKLVLTTTDEGTAASLKFAGGTADADLGISGGDVAAAAAQGTNGIVNVDGTDNTVTNVAAGQSAVLTSGSGGTVTATLSGGLRLGTINAKNVDTGDGTLSAVVNAINGANAGVTASAIQVSPGQFKLQLASASTGLAGAISTSTASLAMGTFSSTGVAQDAEVTVGTGPGAFTVSSSTNSMTTLLPGVTISLLNTGAASVTIVNDPDALATKVGALVEQVNGALKEISSLTGYDAETKTAGLLLGDFALRSLQTSLTSSLTGSVSTSSVLTAASAGVSITKTGQFTFDKAKFTAAYNANPAEVAKLFQKGGTSASTSVSMASATNKTRAGSYGVIITQAAKQAAAEGGAQAGGLFGGTETIDVKLGTTTVSYNVDAGDSVDSVASGLNALFTANGMALLATNETDTLVVRSTGYGTNASFQVRSDTNASGLVSAIGVFETHAGTNVAGTINGVTATGVGRLLQAPPTDKTLAGLTLSIAATEDDVLGAGGTLDLGAFTYVPGVAQRLAIAGTDAIDVVSGTITAAIDGRKRQITDLDTQIGVWDTRLEAREAQLKKMFTAMETALSSMKQQSSWLAGQVNQLSANNNNG